MSLNCFERIVNIAFQDTLNAIYLFKKKNWTRKHWMSETLKKERKSHALLLLTQSLLITFPMAINFIASQILANVISKADPVINLLHPIQVYILAIVPWGWCDISLFIMQREEEPGVGVCGRRHAPVNLHLLARESERDSQAGEEAEEKRQKL